MIGVEPAFGADRQTNAVDREGKAICQVADLRVGPPACAHVVFGMDLDPAERPRVFEDARIMLRFVADAGAVWQVILDDIEHGVGPG